MALPLRHVDGVFQRIDFCSGQDLRQMFAQDWRLQQLRRVVITVSIKLQETVERSNPTQNTTLRTGMNANIMKS